MDPLQFAQLLTKRFRGREERYALQQPTGAYLPRDGTFSDTVAVGHIAGQLTVGLYVLRADSTCWFGALDFDDTQFPDPDAMRFSLLCASRTLMHMGIPHLLERSGRKGYHLWVFFSAPIAGVVAREFLISLQCQTTEETGFPCPVELFPKQAQLDRDGWGNLIKVPWCLHRVTGSRALFVDENLEQYPTLDAQYRALEACEPVPLATLIQFIEEFPAPEKGRKPATKQLTDDDLSIRGKGKVPCTGPMLTTDVRSGGRNQRIYDLAVRLLREGVEKDEAVDRLINFNKRRCVPPDTESSVEKTVESVYQRRYTGLNCESLTAFCAREGCAIWRTHNHHAPPEVTDAIAQQNPSVTLTDLVKLQTDPPIWRLTVDGQPVQMEGSEIAKFRAFRDAVLQSQTKLIRIPREPQESDQQAWERVLRPLLETCTEESAPEDAGESGRLSAFVREWVKEHFHETAEPDQVRLTGWVVPFPGHPEWAAFRAESLRAELDRKRIPYKQNQLWNQLRGLGAQNAVIRTDSKTTLRVIKFPLKNGEVTPPKEGL